jgi:S-DNA-T family DNA segregation ATPase FtsK/SpoIIIE
VATRRRTTRRQGPGAGQIIGKKLAALLGNWAKLTFSDRQTVWRTPVRLWWANLALFIALIALFYFVGASKPLIIVAVLWFLTTLGRAAAIMPKRKRVKNKLYDSTQKILGNPLGTPNRPAPVNQTIRVKRWVGARIEDVSLSAGDAPATKGEFTHPAADKHVITNLGAAPQGMAWVAEWPANNRMHVHLEPEDSPAVGQQETRRTVLEVLTQVMHVNSRDAGSYSVQFDDWEGVTDASGRTRQVPGKMVVVTGPQFDSSLPANRETFVRSFDRQFAGPGEWIYEWDAATVVITQVPKDSAEAKRKRAERKVGDDAQGALRTRAKDPAVTTVLVWDDDEQMIDHPREIEIDFGTRNMADRRTRAAFESEMDTALTANYPESEWLYDWRPGASTLLSMTAVGAKSEDARRKRAETRLRNVVESKFGQAKNFVDCDILEWADDATDSDEAIPQKARVSFGDLDVSKVDTRDEFEQHWDSLSTERDWHYQWATADGEVIIEAVDPLPDAVALPAPGTTEFRKIMDNARAGKFLIGPQKGGGTRYWDFNKIPHGLYGGKTGSGKSVAMNLIFFFGAYNPDLVEFIVCDPKMTDFTWTPEFPAVIRFAATDEQIVEAVSYARQQMESRQKLLNRVGVRNIGQLRSLYRKNPALEKKFGPAPKRLIVFIDELAEFLAKSGNKDVEELKKEAKSDLEAIGRLARAMEVNLVTAAQKPDADIVSTQLSSQLAFRLGVGPLNEYESKQILLSTHGTRFPEDGTPPGRSWAYDSKHGYRMVQVPYIPDEDEACPWDPTVELRGLKPMLREHMKELGYEQITVPNDDGGKQFKWVRLDEAVDNLLDDAGIDNRRDADGDGDVAGAGTTRDASVETLWPDDDNSGDADNAALAAQDAGQQETPDSLVPGWQVSIRPNPLPAAWIEEAQR